MKKENVVLYILIFLIALFIACLNTSYDWDLFARLEVGEIFFKLHTILKHDPFSYTPTLYWFDHEWGSGVIFYAFLKLLGPAGLIILQALLTAGTAFLIIKNNKNIKYPLIISSFFVIMLFFQAGQIVRCHAFSFILTVLTIYILEKFRHQDTKLIWLMPVIMAFWCNVHGGVAAGLGILSVYTLLFIIQRKTNTLKLVLVTFLSYAALLINPYGIRYLAYLYYTVTLPRDFIEDWVCIFHPRFFYNNIPFMIISTLMLVCKISRDIKVKKFDIYHYSIIAIILVLSIIHIKNIPLATVILFTFISSDLDYYLDKIKFSQNLNKSISLVAVILAFTVPLTINTPRASWNAFPLTEVEFLKINNIKGNIIASFGESGYITYKLYPDIKIFVDGRYDGVYPLDVFYDYIRFYYKKEDWANALNNYPTDIIIVELDSDIYDTLKNDKSLDWVEVYQSNLRGVFVKKSDVKSEYKMPIFDINYYRNNLFKTNFINYVKKEDYD